MQPNLDRFTGRDRDFIKRFHINTVSMTNALYLPDWSVSDVIIDENDAYQIAAKYDRTPTRCVNCHASGRLVKRGGRSKTFVDAPVHGRHTYIHVHLIKYTCRACGTTFMQPLRDMHNTHRMTTRLVKYIEKQSLLKPIAHITEDTGVLEGVVRDISNAHYARLSEKHARDLRAPRHIGIDELELGKKQFRAIFIDLDDSWPFEMLRNRSLGSVQNFFMRIPNRRDVETVTMDMWWQYRTAVRRTMPQAAIVADRWHMVDKANAAMDEARRRYQRNLEPEVRTALKAVNGIFLKRPSDLSASETLDLDGWLANSPKLYEAYEAKEALLNIWDLHDRAAAKAALAAWRASIPKDPKGVFSPLLKTTKNWENEILNFFDHHRLTNGKTEARNGAIKRIYNYGAGYDFESIRARALFGKRPDRLKKEVEAKDKAWREAKRTCITCREPLNEAKQMADWKAFLEPLMMAPPRCHLDYVCHACMADEIHDIPGLTSPAAV